MRLRVSLWITLAAVCASLAHADPSATVTVEATSDYDFRGETQTGRQPAAQLSFDYVEDSQWKTGVFMSNVHFGDNSYVGNPRLEVSPYAEIMHRTASGVLFGTGLNYYAYMIDGGQGYDYGELYIDASYHGIKTALFYTPNYDGREPRARLDAWYVSVDATTALIEHLSLMEHAGYAWGDYWIDRNGGAKIDYSLGLNYELGKFELQLQYIATRRMPSDPGTSIDSTGRVVFSVETILPWSKERD
jgi:uncharacterized protein (TIGR02001 family)